MSRNDKALLFINGLEPRKIPEDISAYALIVCTDGAYKNYAKNLPFKIDCVSGDWDSLSPDEIPEGIETIETPDQNRTDFQKTLEILVEKGFAEVDVYGASGKESDHFIGNIAAALEFKNRLKIIFYDDISMFFFSDKITHLQQVKGKIISLIPFFKAENIVTKGLQYPLNQENLTFPERIGTRNIASDDEVEISYSGGELLIYVGNSF